MHIKRAAIISLVIVSFLCVQNPAMAGARHYAVAQGAEKITQNAPQIKTTPPEPIATGDTGGSGKKVLWGVLGLAAVIGLAAAVMSSGGGGGGGDREEPPPETGSVQVSW